MPKGEGKVIAQNKKAHHDYFIEETYEDVEVEVHKGEQPLYSYIFSIE